MAKVTKAAKATRQQTYRMGLSERREPEIRNVDIACMQAFASISAAVQAQGKESGSQRFINALFTEAAAILAAQGFDETKVTEVLARRLSFLAKEAKRPDADPVTRKKWSPPLPSNRFQGYADDDPF